MKKHCKIIAICVAALFIICAFIEAWKVRYSVLAFLLTLVIWVVLSYVAYVSWTVFAELLEGNEQLQDKLRDNQRQIAKLEKLIQNNHKELMANGTKDEEKPAADSSRMEKEEPGKGLTIDRYNPGAGVKPLKLERIRLMGQDGFRLELFCGPRIHITSMIADIILTTEFGDTYEIKEIGFTNFKVNKAGHLLSDITVRPISPEQLLMAKSVSVVVRRYMEDGQKVEIAEEDMELGSDGTAKEWTQEELAYLMPALEALKSGKEIFEALTDYARDGNRILDEGLDAAIKSCMQNENIGRTGEKTYRSTERAMALIKHYFHGPEDSEEEAGYPAPADTLQKESRAIQQPEILPEQCQVQFCSSCGRRLGADENFCINCGTKTGI